MTIPDPSSYPLMWLHRKGGRYVILHHGINEADLKPVVVYQRISDSSVWVRPSEEFFDGRFTPDPGPINTEYLNDR